MGESHGIRSTTPITDGDARDVAHVMQALATPSRVRILGRLRESACTVSELTEAAQMAQPAVSHQLRILRDRQLVISTRRGRNIVYELFDSHVAQLLDESLRHVAHLRAGPDHPPPSDT